MIADRLHWPGWLCWLLKMDAHGNLPQWWQWFFPRWGNYGCPGWSSGRWCSHPDETDWSIPAVDAMDELFKQHDWAYQHGFDRNTADHNLVQELKALEVCGVWATLYRAGAMACFSVWPLL